ncbi:hypothetical protein FKM82_005910 [Ascaphus truei]
MLACLLQLWESGRSNHPKEAGWAAPSTFSQPNRAIPKVRPPPSKDWPGLPGGHESPPSSTTPASDSHSIRCVAFFGSRDGEPPSSSFCCSFVPGGFRDQRRSPAIQTWVRLVCLKKPSASSRDRRANCLPLLSTTKGKAHQYRSPFSRNRVVISLSSLC